MKIICVGKLEPMLVFMFGIIIFVESGFFSFFLLSCLLGLLNIESTT